jgi:hypothetical protein
MLCRGLAGDVRGERIGIVVVLILLVWLLCPAAQGGTQESANPKPAPTEAAKAYSDEDLLKATQNPVADLISVPIQNLTNFRIGPYNRTDNVVSLQPVIPLTLSEDWMLITRIIQPIAWQPYPDQPSGGKFGLGDMNPTLFLSPKNPGKVIWGVGPAMLLPTATNDFLGTGKFSIGPSAVVLVQPGDWTLGALVSNVWSVGGPSDRPAVNRMSLQYFISYILPNDWYVSSAPTMTVDWKASRDDRWLVPVGGGIGKLVMFGNTPVDFAASAYANVVKPTGGPSWQLNLQVTFLFPK